MQLPPSLRDEAASMLLDDPAAANFEDPFLRLVVAHRHLMDASRRARLSEAAHRLDAAGRSRWLAVEAMLGEEPDAGLAQQAWRLALEIGDTTAQALAYAALAADGSQALRDKCLERLSAGAPWLTGAEPRLPEDTKGLRDETLEILLAAEALSKSRERDRIHDQVIPRLDGARRARYRLLSAAKFAPNEASKSAEEALADIDALPDTEARGEALARIRSLVPEERIEQFAEYASRIANDADAATLVSRSLPRLLDARRPFWRDWVIRRTRAATDDLDFIQSFAEACEFLPREQGLAETEPLFKRALALLESPRFSRARSPSFVIAALAWSLTPERQARLLDLLEHFTDSNERSLCLMAMADQFDASNRARALALARRDNDRDCPNVLFARARTLDENERQNVRREALALAAEPQDHAPVYMAGLTAHDVAALTGAIVGMARARSSRFLDRGSWLPVLEHSTVFSIEQRFEMWEILLSSLVRSSRQVALADINDIAKLLDALGGAETRHACAEAILTATQWWP
jgi:hypothetical protein